MNTRIAIAVFRQNARQLWRYGTRLGHWVGWAAPTRQGFQRLPMDVRKQVALYLFDTRIQIAVFTHDGIKNKQRRNLNSLGLRVGCQSEANRQRT